MPDSDPAATAAAPGPLSGVTVADFSRVLAGPYCTQTLGDLGAGVIKVERPDLGDETRSWGPPFANGVSTYYLSVNRNKRSVVIDLRTDEGRRTAAALVQRADVVVENFRRGTMERFGLGYEQLRDANPGLVYCTVSAFGSSNEAQLPGYDFLIQAVSGLMSITGSPDGEPSKVGVALIDVMTGMNAAVGVLAALQHRARTGQGQHVQVNLMSTALSALVNQASAYLNAGVVPTRMGNQHPSITPCELYETADGPIAIVAGNDGQFSALCEAAGVPELAADPRFTSNAARVEHRAALAEQLNAALRHRSLASWQRDLSARGVPCAPVNDLPAAFRLAERVGLRATVQWPGEDGAVVRQVASPIDLSATPPSYRLPPPALDEHGEQVRADLDGRRPGEDDARGAHP